MANLMRVTGAWVQLLTEWLDQEQLPAPDLRAALAGRKPDDAVPTPLWRDWLERAAALRPGLVAPGLAIGALVQPRHVGVLGYLVASVGNLGEAMLAYRRYERLFYGVDLAETAIQRGEAEIRWPPSDPPLGHLGDSVAIAALVTFLRRQIDPAPPPLGVSFVNPPVTADEQTAFEAFFGCPVTFGDSHTRVRFPAAYLTMPMRQADPGLRAVLDRQAQALLLALPDSDPFDRALQQVMLRLLPDGNATLARAARELHVSQRTLQRRLDSRRQTWQQLLDQTRLQLARQYLADRSLTLGDIALLLGFSEQSAFNRAFRRWTGDTPRRARHAGP